jgi:DNA-binding NarL/FixJ family response regulator
MTHRLWLVDDHPVVRAGLEAYLGMQPDLEVVAEAGSIAEVRALDPSSEPDLVLLDLKLPDGSGSVLIDELRALPSQPRVLILTSFLDDRSVRDAMRRGASGYLLKHIGPRALLDKVRATLRGEMPLDPRAVRALSRPVENTLADLTPREREVLELIARGLSNRDIAERLDITEKTVKTHAGHIYSKLEVEGRTQAALVARDLGL